MKKIFLLLSILCASRVFAAADTVKVPIERQYFHDLVNLEQRLLDKADGRIDGLIRVSQNDEINLSVTHTMTAGINDLQDSIELSNKLVKNQDKVRYIRYLENLVRAFRQGWKSKQFNPAYTPMLVSGFENCMMAGINGESMAPFIEALPYETGKIIADILTENKGYTESRKILFLKFATLFPDKILQAIAPFADDPFADSLIVICCKRNPTAVYSAAQAPASVIGKLILRNNNDLVKAVVELSKTPNALLYFPFLDDIIKGKKNIADIKKYVGDGDSGYDSIGYYKLLVRTEIDYFKRMSPPLKDTPIAMFGPNGLREVLQKKAIDHFITQINTLHNQGNINVRMRSTDPLSAIDLYYMIVLGENEIYTSSYKHSFNRLLQRLGKNAKTDSLLLSVNFDNFKKFIKMAASFNKLDTFLKLMPPARSQMLMKAFVGNLDQAGYLEDAVDVADSYSSISDKKLLRTILGHVVENENIAIQNDNARGKLVYGLLKTIFLSSDSSNHIDLTKAIGIPSVYTIDNKDLSDDSGRIVQQVFFYGDEDGKAYFPGFINSFPAKDWSITMKPEWAEIKSRRGKKIWIYANRPLNNDENLDDTAQQHLNRYLDNNELYPSVVVHRGHSYWFPYTLKLMPDNAKIVIVGSCGGFKNISQILKFSPDANIISTKEIGKGDINTSVLTCLNQNLMTGKTLVWKNMWGTLTRQFAGNADTKESWEDYIPPYRNLGVIFMKAYNKKILDENN